MLDGRNGPHSGPYGLAPEAASDCQKYVADVNSEGDVDSRDVQPFVNAIAP